MNITCYIADKAKIIDQHLASLIPEKKVEHSILYEAARYSLLGPGKRIRPILTLATTEALQGNVDHALTPACALELIHTYSLIHDDLPCMDNDDYRRGRLTLHRVYPEGHAVLTGDYLLTFAFELISEAPHLHPQQKLKLITLLARHAGGEGMIAGQVLDIAAEGKKIDISSLQAIHRGKTAAMITASIEFGGVISCASQEQMGHLHNFGQQIGLAFQIIDDILDITSSQEKHGRSVASDIVNQKTTYVSLLGLDKAKEAAQQSLNNALEVLHKLKCDTTILQALAKLIVER